MIAALSLAVAVLSALATLTSVLYIRSQRDANVKAAQIALEVSGASTLSQAIAAFQQILLVFIQFPRLRPYFYAGASPIEGSDDAYRSDTVSEMLLDAIESALDAAADVESFRRHEADWITYSEYLFVNSPCFLRAAAQTSIHPRVHALADARMQGA